MQLEITTSEVTTTFGICMAVLIVMKALRSSLCRPVLEIHGLANGISGLVAMITRGRASAHA